MTNETVAITSSNSSAAFWKFCIVAHIWATLTKHLLADLERRGEEGVDESESKTHYLTHLNPLLCNNQLLAHSI